MTETTADKIPISEFYKVIDYVTIFKSNTWREAIVVYESYGRKQSGCISG